MKEAKNNCAGIICFSENGKQTARVAAVYLESQGMETELWLKSRYAVAEAPFLPVEESLTDWAGSSWGYRVLVFVGALGIAVRAIAPHVKSKRTDPAVLVLDEGAHFCIPLLSGHLGGANRAALGLAAHTGSIPVVTTATDVHGLFAVDVFAKHNGLRIDNMTLAKEVSAALLAGQSVGIYTEMPLESVSLGDTKLQETGKAAPENGSLFSEDAKEPAVEWLYDNSMPEERNTFLRNGLPWGLMLFETEQEAIDSGLPLGIYIGYRTDCTPFPQTLKLVPDVLAVGIGCRRGASAGSVSELFYQAMEEGHLDVRAVARLASIDLKKDEAGIVRLADSLGVPFVTYDAEVLKNVPGAFSASAFVQDVTGVDNVCERSAVLASGNGILIKKKRPGQGVTAAVAAGNRRIRFE